MKILVTGGAGFIGSHLAEKLLEDGHYVVVVDDLSTGKMENIAHLRNLSEFEYHIDTIFNQHLMAELVDLSDIVFHLAAAVGVKLIVDNPVWTIETNVKGTEIILELASKKKKKVIISSTSEVYGKSEDEKFTESSDFLLGPTIKSRWSYAASKILDEFLGLAYCKQKGTPVVIVRLFNIVGPRQSGQYGMVVPRFVSQALKNKPITVYGDGKQTRTFTHIKDTVEAMVKLAFHPASGGEIFNIGGKEEISIIELAKKVKKNLNSSSEIVFIPYDKAYAKGFEDMKKRVPDISKVKKWINWEPKLTIEDIIKDVAEHELNKTSKGTIKIE